MFIFCSLFLTLDMTYLLLATLFYSINDFLWSQYAKKDDFLSLINKRSMFTTLFVGVLFVVYSKDLGLILEGYNSLKILLVSSIGFLGLCLLVKGFLYGSLIQFCVYILLTTSIVGLVSSYKYFLSFYEIIPSLVFIGLGYLYFIVVHTKEAGNHNHPVKSHLYFIAAQLLFIVLVIQQYEYLALFEAVDIAFYQEFTVLLLSSILLLFKKKNTPQVKTPIRWREFALIALPISIAQLSNLQGLQLTNPFYEKLFGLLGPLLSVVLAMIFAKERHQTKTYVAFVMMLIGYYLLQI